jgi:hypothetical protein
MRHKRMTDGSTRRDGEEDVTGVSEEREREMGKEREEMRWKMRNGRVGEDALTGKCSHEASLRREEPLWLFPELLGYKTIFLSREGAKVLISRICAREQPDCCALSHLQWSVFGKVCISAYAVLSKLPLMQWSVLFMRHFLFSSICSAIPDLWFKLVAVLLIIMLLSSNTETGETLPGFRGVFS